MGFEELQGRVAASICNGYQMIQGRCCLWPDTLFINAGQAPGSGLTKRREERLMRSHALGRITLICGPDRLPPEVNRAICVIPQTAFRLPAYGAPCGKGAYGLIRSSRLSGGKIKKGAHCSPRVSYVYPDIMVRQFNEF